MTGKSVCDGIWPGRPTLESSKPSSKHAKQNNQAPSLLFVSYCLVYFFPPLYCLFSVIPVRWTFISAMQHWFNPSAQIARRLTFWQRAPLQPCTAHTKEKKKISLFSRMWSRVRAHARSCTSSYTAKRCFIWQWLHRWRPGLLTQNKLARLFTQQPI